MGGFIMSRFTLPRDIYFGEGSLEVLKSIKGKKALIVSGGSSMKKFGFLQKVEDYLNKAAITIIKKAKKLNVMEIYVIFFIKIMIV